jgi:HTH-type transcriptional regulator/antitoxin HigA
MVGTPQNWIQHPGFYLKEEMEARGWLQRDLAFILGIPEQAVNIIVSGKRAISPDMARALGDAFDVPAEFFANLQNAYDLSRAQEPSPAVSVRAKMQSNYPVREMIKRGWFEDGDPTLLNMQLVRFFEVAGPDEIPYLAHAAKKSSYEERGIPPTQLAWLFRVRQIAKSISVPRYAEKSLRGALTRLSALLVEPEEAGQVPRILMESGVRFIMTEGLSGAKIDGVCFWLDRDSPVVAMSMRYDRIDNFWFVLRHEIEHVLRRHGQSTEIIDTELEGKKASTDPSLPEQERVANAAAADFCASSVKVDSFIARKRPFFYEKDVVALARVLSRHPGLVVGQIQRKIDRHDYLRKYQVKIRSFVVPGAIVDGWGQSIPISM